MGTKKKEEEKTGAERRRDLRFPAPLSMKAAHIDPVYDETRPFTTFYLGLIIELSAGGMKVVLSTQHQLVAGQKCRIRFGRNNVIPCKVVWMEEIKYALSVIGLEFRRKKK